MTKVYRFRKYDISTDEFQTSKRMGTLEAIAAVGGDPIMDASKEAAEEDLDSVGLTARDYWFKSNRSGFQQNVT
jgi:hypothetical protein